MDKNKISFIRRERKKTSAIIVSIASIIVLAMGFILQQQVNVSARATTSDLVEDMRRFESLGFRNVKDLSEPLNQLGLKFYVSSNPQIALIDTQRKTPHLVQTTSGINISSKDDVDVLLEFARLHIEHQRGFSWDGSVDNAIIESGFYDYWRSEFRMLTRSMRNKQLIYMAENFAYHDLMILFSQRPCVLEEFQDLGFFKEINMNVNVHNRNR